MKKIRKNPKEEKLHENDKNFGKKREKRRRKRKRKQIDDKNCSKKLLLKTKKLQQLRTQKEKIKRGKKRDRKMGKN